MAVNSAVAATLLSVALAATIAFASSRILADDGGGLFSAERPAAVARLAAGAG